MNFDKQHDHYFKLASLFVGSAVVTGIFSGSLVRIANAKVDEVLATGLIVPSFTWVVQLLASNRLLKDGLREDYQIALGRTCLLGSVALLPAAAMNWCMVRPPIWISAANVLVSVAVMAAALFWMAKMHQISRWWPVSWCATIAVNIALFLWVSRSWWSPSI